MEFCQSGKVGTLNVPVLKQRHVLLCSTAVMFYSSDATSQLTHLPLVPLLWPVGLFVYLPVFVKLSCMWLPVHSFIGNC